MVDETVSRPTAAELTERIARCVGIWETNRGGDAPDPRESGLHTVAGVRASMATIEQATMPHAVTEFAKHTSLREQAQPPLTKQEIADADKRCVAVAHLLSSVHEAFNSKMSPDDFIKSNSTKIQATGLVKEDVRVMFEAAALHKTIVDLQTTLPSLEQKKLRASAVAKAVAKIPENARVGLNTDSLEKYLDVTNRWGENAAAWQRKAVQAMPNQVAARIEKVVTANHGETLARLSFRTEVDAALARKPSATTKELVISVSTQNNSQESGYGANVYKQYNRLYHESDNRDTLRSTARPAPGVATTGTERTGEPSGRPPRPTSQPNWAAPPTTAAQDGTRSLNKAPSKPISTSSWATDPSANTNDAPGDDDDNTQRNTSQRRGGSRGANKQKHRASGVASNAPSASEE
jgi:hypothetical protein